MHIILVSSRLTKARALTLTAAHVITGGLTMVALGFVFAVALLYMGLRHASEIRLPVIESLVLSAQQEQAHKAESFLRENLNAMAVKLGQMQAQLVRLDALGERLSALAGLKPQEFRFSEAPGRGGAISTVTPPRDLSMDELSRQLDTLSKRMENRSDDLGILESTLFDARVKRKLMPTIMPVDASWNASALAGALTPSPARTRCTKASIFWPTWARRFSRQQAGSLCLPSGTTSTAT